MDRALLSIFIAIIMFSPVWIPAGYFGFHWLMDTEINTSTPTPNLYELTRQTAENTRHIFWLIVVCFTAWITAVVVKWLND